MDMKEHVRLMMHGKNNLAFWYPKVKDVVDTPRTIILEADRTSGMKWLMDGKFPPDFVEKAKEYASEIGYPLFLRTTETSCKHSFDDTCYVAGEDQLIQHMFNLIEGSENLGMLGLPFNGFVFRGFLSLRNDFKAFRGFPVSWEIRTFIRDGEVECMHNYWPKAAIRNPTTDDWEEQYDEMHRYLTDFGFDEVRPLAKAVAQVLDGYWSADFAFTTAHGWVLIDCALGEVSYHWADCHHNPEREEQMMKESRKEKAKTPSETKKMFAKMMEDS